MDDVKGSASSTEQTIPKSRFDEVVGQKNELAKQTEFLQNLVLQQQQATQRQRAPAAPNPRLEKLKTENPELYEQFVEQERRTKQLSAGYANLHDEIDRQAFLNATGPVGKKRLQEVEKHLEAERSKGNFNVNRGSVLQWLLGQERLQEELNGKPKNTEATEQAAETTEESSDAPPTNPKLATTVGTSKGTTKAVEKTREERMEELDGVEF